VKVSVEHQPSICSQCDSALIELEAYGERLCGCVECNNWQSFNSGEWRHLPNDDIDALRGMVRRWMEAAMRPNR